MTTVVLRSGEHTATWDQGIFTGDRALVAYLIAAELVLPNKEIALSVVGPRAFPGFSDPISVLAAALHLGLEVVSGPDLMPPDGAVDGPNAGDEISKHTPGGVDHDQRTHGRRGGTSTDIVDLYAEHRLFDSFGNAESNFTHGDIRYRVAVHNTGQGTILRVHPGGKTDNRFFSGGEAAVVERLYNPEMVEPPPPEKPKPKMGKVTGQVTSQSTEKKTFAFNDEYAASDLVRDLGTDEFTQPPEEVGQAIFNTKIETDLGTYSAEVTSVDGYYDGGYKYEGTVIGPDGEPAGYFERALTGTSVYNAHLQIKPEHQGKGLGTALLSHWEDELRAAGFTEMNLSTAGIGNYAWAVAGYEWEDPQQNLDFLRVIIEPERAEEFGFDRTFAPEYFDMLEAHPSIRDDVRRVVQEYDDNGFVPVFDVATIGITYRENGTHFGKEFLINGYSWEGTKPL